MSKTRTRVWSIILAFAMVVSLLPATALAVGGAGTEIDPYRVASAQDMTDALNQSGPMTYIRLSNSFIVDSAQNWTIGSGKSVVLDLAGYTLTNTYTYDTSSYYVLKVNGGSLTLEDSSPAKTGTIDVDGSNSYGIQILGTGSTFIMNGGTVTSEGKCALDMYALTRNATVEINGGKLATEMHSNMAIGVRGSDTTFTMRGGEIVNPSGMWAVFASADGSAPVDSLTLTFDGGKITSDGTGIYIDYPITVNFGGTAIVDASGYGINMSGTGVLNMTGGTVQSDSAAIYSDESSVVKVSGGSLTGAQALEITENSTAQITNGMFTGDVEGDTSNNITITGGTFTDDVDEYLPEGMGQDDITGEITISGDAEASIGNRGYRTLEEALEKATSGDEILLRKNVELDNTLTIDSTKSGITINGAGLYTISPSSSFASGNDLVLVTGQNGGVSGVTIRNLTVDGSYGGTNTAGYGIQFYCAENCAIENVKAVNNTKRGIHVNASTVTASGTIELADNGWGDAINVGFGSGIDDAPGASLDVTNATLEGVTAIYADADAVEHAGDYNGPGSPVTITVKDASGRYVAIADDENPVYFIPEAEAAANTVITVENPDGEVLRYTKTTSLPAAIDAADHGAVITLADREYDVTTNRESDSTYGSDLIIDKDNVTIQAADGATPVIYGFTNKYSAGTGDEGICGQSTVFVSGRNVTLQDLTIMPLGAYAGGNGKWFTTKAVEVTKGATGFVMAGCEITANPFEKDDQGAHNMVGGGPVYFETNDATLDLNSFGEGTTVLGGWLGSTADDGYYSVDASGNYWGEDADYDDVAAMLGDGATVNDWYTHRDANGNLSGLRVVGGILIVADQNITGATVTFPDAIQGEDYEVASGGQVNFTIALEDETEVQDVYAAYSPDGTGTRYLTVTPVTSTIYTFTAPDAADFSAGVDKTVTVYVTTNSTAKSEVTLDLELDGTKKDETSGGDSNPEYITAGSTLTAVVTVQEKTRDAITDATGARVQFTWPDGTITYGYVNGEGTATSQWTPSDAFANGLYVGDSDWIARQKKVTVEFFGTEKYKSAKEEETVTIKSRTIAQVADLKIVATPNDGGLSVQQLEVLSTYALSLSENNYPVLNAQGVKLKNNIDYTITWYVNNGNGEWTELTDESAVKPKNINTKYKVVFTPAGEYSLGGFELVIGCGELKGTDVTTTTNVNANQPLYEGQFLRVTATVTDEDGKAVTSGEVVFYAERLGEPWTPTELGRVALVNDGRAALSLTNLPAGEYQIAAYYLGAEGVYAASEGESPAFEIQSATLPEAEWSIKIGDGSETNISVGEETRLSISAPAGVVAADYRVEWLVSKDGGETWLLAGNDATLIITPANKLYQYRALVYPTGNYTQPVNGIALTKVTASADDQIETTLDLTMMPESVFEGETFVLRAQVLAGDVPVTGGYVTFTTDDGFSYAAPVDAAGYAEATILGGVSEKTLYTATYTDPSKIYKDSKDTLPVTPNTREIEMKADACITADSADFTVGETVVLTPPAVFAKGSDTRLTAGRDFYYQWQYSTDYVAGAGNYTATWLNFSAPLAGGSADENAIRVTIGDANTAFRVIAVPYGNYQYPAGGVVTEPICGNAKKIQTETRISIRSLENGTEIFDGDEVLFSAKVVDLNGKPVTEGFVQFSVTNASGLETVLGTVLLNDEGIATLTTTVYADQMESVTATYFGTSKYAASDVTDDLNINSATIAVRSVITGTFAVNEETSVTLPVVIDADDAAKVLKKDVDYYIVWYVDDGEGWYELVNPEYANDGSLKFTPANENTRLAAVVFPMGDYMFPVDGIAAGVIGDAKKVTTATTLTTSDDWHEGSTITLTAAVKADQKAVLDGKVEFYATIGGTTTSVMIGSAALNKNGEAVLTYTLPAYNATDNSISFTAKYIGTDVYDASEATVSDGKILSATITFGDDPKITIADSKNTEVEPTNVQVGVAYKLTAPDVYETGKSAATDSPLTYGEDYYYVWQYSEDGKTWETVYSTMENDGYVYKNAVFGNENAQYRAVAYPIIASGTTYRYPATGIVVATSLWAKTIDTATELAIGNAYVVNGGTKIYPEGRTITLTATVTEQDRSSVPAYGTVKFYYKNDSTSAGKALPLGTMSLDPGGSATLSIAAPAATGSAYIFYAVFEGNTVYAASSSDYTNDNVFVLPNEIALTGDIAIYGANNSVVDPDDAVVGTAYTLKGATATVKSDDATAQTVLDYIKAVNAAVKDGKAPAYYSYVWQKSEDDGKTWTNLANNTDTLTNVTFDSSLTVYRLAAFPVESTGWVAPAEGVTSNEVSVGKQSTDVTITLTDVATGTVLANKSNVFEGAEVQVTVDVSKVADKLGTDGTVTLEMVRKHDGTDDANRLVIPVGSADVNNAGKAVFTVVLPAYSYNPANGLSNQINFKVTFTGDDYFAGDTLNVGETYLKLASAAITWKDETGTFTDAVKSITIYEGTEAKGTTVTEMAANGTYTLAIPEIYAGDVYSTGVRKNELLTVNEDYTVAWQVRMTGENAATWRTLDGASGDTYTVTCTEGQEKYSYRAVITPMGDYSKAMDLIFGDPTPSATLTTLATADTELAATTTTLAVSGTVAEDASVAIGGDTPFEMVGPHQTQYEGANVTLTATVENDDGKVNDGLVYFYRINPDGTTTKINEVGVKVDANGVATLTVATSAWDDAKSVTKNVDSYYADYEGTTVFDKSSSSDVTGLVDVYVRSTTIATPRISATYKDGADGTDTTTKYTTSDANLKDLPAAVEMTFALVQNNTSAISGYSVTATDGRWLKEGVDFTMQWYRENPNVSEGGSESNVNVAIDGATESSYVKDASSLAQKFSIFLTAIGNMKTGAWSKQAIIGDAATPELALDIDYSFEPDAADLAGSVVATDGAHYGDIVTLTATVKGDEAANALPTGTVTFYYRTSDNNWTQLGDPVSLVQKDTVENKLVAIATYTLDTTKIPFNITGISFSYSGDSFYDPFVEVDAKKDNAETYKAFKLWSIQISNPIREGIVDMTGYTPDYTDPACYPDGVSYGNLGITIYKVNADGNRGEEVRANAKGEKELQAETEYILEIQDVYTKSGEKLNLAKDNSADITVEWYKSTDNGKTWGPLPETEYTNLDAKTIQVTPATKDYQYMVKIITTPSFYNSQFPELEDFEYSEDGVVTTTLQDVTVSVTAKAETPVNGNDNWVYQANPITLFATVSPVEAGEPTGTVEFYYTVLPDGATVNAADGTITDSEGNAIDLDANIWTAVVSDGTDGGNTANLVETTSETDVDAVMVAELTTSSLPVDEDGTYSNIVIKAVYLGDATFKTMSNITSGDPDDDTIASSEIVVFSSKILQDESIPNHVLTFTKDADGTITWTYKDEIGDLYDGDLYDGVIITAKTLKSDGTSTVITLNPVYTIDANDRDDAIFTDLAAIYTLTAGVDYEVEWQYCANYEAYKQYLSDPATYDKNWQQVDDSLVSNYCTVEQVQGYAYRAVVTPLDTEKAQQSFRDADRIYSNILVVEAADARLLTNIRNASSASANGDTVYVDAIVMGGTTTPIGNVTLTVKEKRTNEVVFTETQNLVNGWTTFKWQNVQPGEYTLELALDGNNGYEAAPITEDYIVRFTAQDQLGDAGVPGVLTLTVNNPETTYNGQVQMLDADDVTLTGFTANYSDWEAMALDTLTFQYYDEDGNRVAEPKDAGTYQVKAYLPESMYWGYVAAEGTYTITQREVEITDVIAQDKVYNGDTTANIQTIELALSPIDAKTGLPTGNTGLVEGDSLYVQANGVLSGANAGAQTLTLDGLKLMGPDADNYVIANPDYSESFTVSRNMLKTSAVTAITAAPGYELTDLQFYMIDQYGTRITTKDAEITYLYHDGNDITPVENTNLPGEYTVLISMDETNYNGGASLSLYIVEGFGTAQSAGTVDTSLTSAVVEISNTYHVYDGTAKSVTVTPADATVEYAAKDGTDDPYSTTAPTDAGRYMVRATKEGMSYYGIMTIVKGEPQFDINASSDPYTGRRYNGGVSVSDLDQILKDSNPGWNFDGAYAGKYLTYVGGSIVGYDYNAPRDVSYDLDGAAYDDSVTSGAYGTYVVTAHYPETANTVAVTASAEYEITKAALTITGDDIYTRRFDTHSKLTATYEGFVGEVGSPDSELRDLIALPTFQLSEDLELTGESLTNVGNLPIILSKANARNYKITYVNGIASTAADSTQDDLAIRGIPSTIYYGDSFQLFLYGSSDGTTTNESSAVTWTSSNPGIATIDEFGKVTITGVGKFTITAVRGDDPDTQIEITSADLTALARRNDFVVAREDVLYDGTEKTVGADLKFYYMSHGTRFVNDNPPPVSITLKGTDAGEYLVGISYFDPTATETLVSGSALLAIHRAQATVKTEAATKVYGNENPKFTYETSPVGVLRDARVETSAFEDSDTGVYELLVAGGTADRNYVLAYALDDERADFTVNKRALTFRVGSLAGTNGQTKQWRTKDGTLGYVATIDLASAELFERHDDRVFGERNQILDYEVDGLIQDDSLADLWDASDRADIHFAQLNEGFALSAEAAANRKLDGTTQISHEVGTIDHVKNEEDIKEAWYVITGKTSSRNYNVTIQHGTQNVTQRKVSIANTVVAVPAGTTAEDLITVIGPQLSINGLAANLNHNYTDLLLGVKTTVSTDAGAGSQTVELTCGNTNYVLDDAYSTITVVIGEVTGNGYFIEKTEEYTILRLQRTLELANGTTRVEAATGIVDLKLTITDRTTNGELAVGVMTEITKGSPDWNDAWDTNYAYYILRHESVDGHKTRYRLEATGYNFNYTNN